MYQITDIRCVLAVRDLAVSTQFYIDVLGFKRDFGDGSDGWSFLSRDAFKIRLGECPDEKPASELGNHSYFVYLDVQGIDKLHQELLERGAPILSQPEDQPWGTREFSVSTPDGHRIRFGEQIASR